MYLFLDIDECKNNTNTCGENESCANMMGSYNCICKKGFNGKPCQGIYN